MVQDPSSRSKITQQEGQACVMLIVHAALAGHQVLSLRHILNGREIQITVLSSELPLTFIPSQLRFVRKLSPRALRQPLCVVRQLLAGSRLGRVIYHHRTTENTVAPLPWFCVCVSEEEP